MSGSGGSTSRRTRSGVVIGLAVLLLAAGLLASGLGGSGGTQLIDPTTRFLVAVAVVLTVCHLFGALMRRVGQPAVLGEIIGGLVLGPSALGLLWPAATDWLFPPVVVTSLNTAAQLGLVVFMFLLGSGLRTDRDGSPRLVAASVAGGMGLPFVAGAGLALATGTTLAGDRASSVTYPLFFGLALAITALPVLARILIELDIQHTRVGTVALSGAALGDGVAWLALTVILAGVGTGAGPVATTAVLATALVVATFLCLRPALALLVDRVRGDQTLTVVLVAGAIGYAALTQAIHLHPLIGAFLFGAAVPRDCAAVERIREQLIGFTLTVLLPLFFAGVGLVTSVGLLGGDPRHWLLFAGVLVLAQVSKVIGAGGGARLAGMPGRQALTLGVLMNCRGVTELVVATVGLQYGLVNELGFTVLVLVAVITTALTGPVTRRLIGTAGPPEADRSSAGQSEPGQREYVTVPVSFPDPQTPAQQAPIEERTRQ